MDKKTAGICCGGDYTISADLVNSNAHQSSPSKRHNAKTERVFLSEAERKKLGLYIAGHLEYEQEEYPDRIKHTPLYMLIDAAIDAYASINYDE